MFKFADIRQVHLEISNNCQASCPMCTRNINGGIENPLIKITNWSLDDFKTIMHPLLPQLDSYYFCGTFGDPMMNNDLIEMCLYSSQVAPNVKVTVHTNGGARKAEWWSGLADALPENHLVVFALDGLEDTHHLYRVGTDFNTVIRNAKAFIDAGGKAEWCFLKFRHNEHQVEIARQMSQELGFFNFRPRNSSRFVLEPKRTVVDRQGNITYYIEPATSTPLTFIDRKVVENYKKIVKESIIDCKAQHDKEIYIDAHKDLYPCCWIANIPYTPIQDDISADIRMEMKRQHESMVQKLGEINVLKRSVKEIVDSQEFQIMWNDYWGEDKLIICARSCGQGPSNTFAKCTDQDEV